MSIVMRAQFFLLLCACSLSVACQRHVSVSDLYGSYIADYAEATEELQLNPDLSYMQCVTLKTSGRVDVAKGKWRYNGISGYISFSDRFMVVLDGYHQLDKRYYDPTQGEVTQPVAKRLGRISIGSAEGIVYRKR